MAPKTTDDLLAGNDPLFTAVDGVALCSLTKRELFAAMAMQGLLGAAWHPDMGVSPFSKPEETARTAVQIADALLAELAKPIQ